MTPWDITSSVLSALTGAAAILLGIRCLWPPNRPHHPTRTPSPPRCPLRPISWPPEFTCTAPKHPLTIPEAHRCMQLHRNHNCPRKHAAFITLVAAGRITPDSSRHHP
ncbi:hypothetical protein ABIA39_004705 [Nocardia sp. GAS34]|uniref:hypothetical protein n=1 Tax=unclassified Nocardia TaxID=2637762 RepID=UPI003D1968A6